MVGVNGKILKITIRSITIVCAAFVLSAAGARASDWSDKLHLSATNLYLSADFGGAFQQNAIMTQSLAPGWRPTASFNAGNRADIDLGYNLNDSLAVELETGFMWNSMDKVGGASLNSYSQSVDIYSVPVLANVIYKAPLKLPMLTSKGPVWLKTSWTPYFGVGAGGVVSMFDLKNSGIDYSDTDFTFAYQAEAGLDHALSKNVSIGIAYKFLGTLNQRYYLGGAENNHIKLGGVYIHAVVAKLTWTF